jgi:hypothetical protein
MLKVYGKAAISDFLGDRIVYRNLVPVDRRLPGLDTFRDEVAIPAGVIPRKSEGDYARAVVYLLGLARKLDAPTARIRRLIFIGDTRLNDGTAFDNLCRAGGWPGLAFIGSESAKSAATEVTYSTSGQAIFLSNRWASLVDDSRAGFEHFRENHGFPLDEDTVVVVDLDKTALGARGRNAQAIDQARVQAVRNTVADLLGSEFDPQTFQTAYDQLNQVEFHPFTRDNQDYLAYICLILGSGIYALQELIRKIQTNQLESIQAFMAQVESRSNELLPALGQIHRQIYDNVQAGDPTPFKAFRRNEFLVTVSRMGHLPDDAPVQALLENEILITREVQALVMKWLQKGVLLFGLSDKPDEASLPTPEQAIQGYLPIHRTPTHIVGE